MLHSKSFPEKNFWTNFKFLNFFKISSGVLENLNRTEISANQREDWLFWANQNVGGRTEPLNFHDVTFYRLLFYSMALTLREMIEKISVNKIRRLSSPKDQRNRSWNPKNVDRGAADVHNPVILRSKVRKNTQEGRPPSPVHIIGFHERLLWSPEIIIVWTCSPIIFFGHFWPSPLGKTSTRALRTIVGRPPFYLLSGVNIFSGCEFCFFFVRNWRFSPGGRGAQKCWFID